MRIIYSWKAHFVGGKSGYIPMFGHLSAFPSLVHPE